MVGLTVSAEGIALCRLSPDAESHHLSHCQFHPCAQSQDIPQTLSRVVREQGLAGSHCVLVLDMGEYKIIRTDAPPVEADELREAVRWKIQDQLEWDDKAYVLDVFPLPESRQSGRPKTVCAVVAESQPIQQRIDWIAQSELELTAITIPELALTAFVSLMPENQTGLLMMHPQTSQGLLLAAKNEWMYLSRHVRLVAEPSRSLSLDATTHSGHEQLILEIQRSLDYFESYFAEPAITALVMTPSPTQQGANMLASLQQNLNLQARTMDLTALFESAQPLDDELQARCLIPAGAALSELAA